MDSFCPDCGYALSKHAVTTASDLYYSLKAIHNNKDFTEEMRISQEINAIKMFPIPNDVENILEFLSISLSKITRPESIYSGRSRIIIWGFVIFLPLWLFAAISYFIEEGGFDLVFAEDYIITFGIPTFFLVLIFLISRKFKDGSKYQYRNDLSNAWKSKFEEVLYKGKLLFNGNPAVYSRLISIEKEYEQKLNKKTSKWKIIMALVLLISVLVASKLVLFNSAKITSSINNNDYNTAVKYVQMYLGPRKNIEKQVIQIVRHFVEEKDYSRAEQFVYSTDKNDNEGMIIQIYYDLLLDDGLYEEASKFIPGVSISSLHSYDCKPYFMYLQDCITRMCNKGEIVEAEKFMKTHLSIFSYADDWTEDYKAEYGTEAVILKLSSIIDSYRMK